jgi:hypothetical protein
MLSQTGEHAGDHGIAALYRNIIEREGIRGLWAGNGANLLRIFPAKAVVFGGNDFYTSLLKRASNTSADVPLNYSLSFLAGGLAGMSASATTYPLDFARGRISGKLAAHGQTKAYGGILQTLLITIQDEGFLALWKGVKPTLLGAMPYEGMKFGTVAVLEAVFPKDTHTKNSDSSQQPFLSNGPARKMVFGGMGGVIAGFVMYPNDTVRRLLQLQGSRGTTAQYNGYWDCVVRTYQAEGIARFYRGMTINIIRMAPNTAVQFGSYELLKNWTSKWM